MAYRDDLDAARARRETLTRELADVRARLDEARDLAARERELAAAVAEAGRDVDHARARASLPMLREVRIASPCQERWEEMTGDDRVRHCARCAKDVFDLSAMAAADAEALLVARGASACLRLYRRFDGTVITSDCPEGAYLRRKRRVVAATAVITAVILGAVGVASTFAEERAAESRAGTHVGEMGQMAEPVRYDPPVGGVPPPPEPRPPEQVAAEGLAARMLGVR